MLGYDPHVFGMALIRFLSAAIEFSAALLMLRFNRVEAAIGVNAALGLVGPLILLFATMVGVLGISGRVSPGKLLLIILGVALILRGTR